MSTDRERILGKVRDALAPLGERAALPDFGGAVEFARNHAPLADPVAEFTERMKAVNGEVISGPAALAQSLRARGWMHGYCDPALWTVFAPHFGEPFTVETVFDRSRVDDYAFGITRGAGAIAETGTIILDDETSSSRLAALAPWAHIAVIPRGRLYPDLPAAVAALGRDPNIVWCTGPSKTADVEGILIEGVHGPGVQVAIFVD